MSEQIKGKSYAARNPPTAAALRGPTRGGVYAGPPGRPTPANAPRGNVAAARGNVNNGREPRG